MVDHTISTPILTLSPPCPFLALPRELRDAIYTFLASPVPATSGPLKGYVMPSTELLKTNKQLRREYSAIFYKLLPSLLNSRRVVLALDRKPRKTEGQVKQRMEAKQYCIGWHFWTLPGAPWYSLPTTASAGGPLIVSSTPRKPVPGGLQIWIHTVPSSDEDTEKSSNDSISWWMDLYQIHAPTARGPPQARGKLPRQASEAADLLDKILRHAAMRGEELVRVRRVVGRLQEAKIAGARAREGKVKEEIVADWGGGIRMSLARILP